MDKKKHLKAFFNAKENGMGIKYRNSANATKHKTRAMEFRTTVHDVENDMLRFLNNITYGKR